MRRPLVALALVAPLAACHGSTSETTEATPSPAVTSSVDQAPLVPAASKQTVRIHLAPRDAGLRRAFLPGLTVERVDDGGGAIRLPLDAPLDCPCPPCAAPAAPKPAGPAVAELAWDARAYVVRPYVKPCSGVPGRDRGEGMESALQPVSPGRYRARFLVTVCTPLADAGCKEMGARPGEAEIDLPASGDVDVTVP